MKKIYHTLTGFVIFGMILFTGGNNKVFKAPEIEIASINNGDQGIWDYTGTYYNLGAQDIFPEGFFWDGTYWWMIGSDSDRVHKYNSDWSYIGLSYDISGQFTTPTDIFWDGSNWWGLGDGTADRVYRYDSNWVYTGTSYYIGGQEPAAKGIFWDGTNWWLVGLHNRVIYQYSSSWSYTGISHYIGGQDGYPSDLFWDGEFWWVAGIYSDAIHKYNSDWSYTGISYDTSGQDDYPTDIFWDGTNWWMLGYGNSRVFEYSALNNDVENTPPDQDPFLTFIIVGISIGIFAVSLIFIYALIMKKKNAQILVREIIENKKGHGFNGLNPKSTVQMNHKQIHCIFCGTANLKGWKFCTNCGKHMKSEKVLIDTSEFLGGFIISLIGGMLSIAVGFGIPFVYPELVNSMESVMQILQLFMVMGGAVSIIGAILVYIKPKLGGIIVLVGSFIAGINIITIIGATRIFRKIRS